MTKAETATLNLLNVIAMELFDVVQTCINADQVTADDWEEARAALAHGSAALASTYAGVYHPANG